MKTVLIVVSVFIDPTPTELPVFPDSQVGKESYVPCEVSTITDSRRTSGFVTTPENSDSSLIIGYRSDKRQ